MKNNPSITIIELMKILGLGRTSVQKYIRELTNDKVIKRVGSNKKGYWEVID